MKKRPDRLPKLIFVLLLALCSPLVSLAQPAQEEAAMERFDIETFNRNKNKYIWLNILPDGTKVAQIENEGEGYLVETTPPHSAYTEVKFFDYEGCLASTALRFFSIHVGTIKEYNAKGGLIREYDQDKGFAFSINNLIQKMKEEYKVDIVDTRKVFTVYRGIDQFANQELPVYGVYVYGFSGGRTDTTQTIAYLFHGGTGELLYSIPADIEGSPDIMTEYQKLAERNKANP